MAEPRPEPPSRPLPPGVIRLGTVAGSDVLVTPSWFLVAAVIVVVMAPVVDAFQPGLGAFKYVAGFAFAVILYGSVLIHEAAHAVVARRLGYPVGPIMLQFLGGATEIEEESRRPRDEFLIAVVGPIASLVVAGVAGLLWWGHPDGLLLLAVRGLATANLLVGCLNLVPGLPLDGGRVTRAAVWRLTNDLHRATLVAGWLGRIAAVALVLWPFVQQAITGRPASTYDVVWALLIAMFLWTGATASMRAARFRQRIPNLVARDLARRTLAVPEDLPIAEAVRRAQEAHAGSIITVTASGVPTGVVNEAALIAVHADRRPWVPTSAVSRTLTDGLSLPASIAGEDLVRALGRTPSTEYLLLDEDGSVYGVLATADVDAAFQRSGR